MFKFFIAFLTFLPLFIKTSICIDTTSLVKEKFDNSITENRLEQDTRLEIIYPNLNFDHKTSTVNPLINLIIRADINFKSNFRPDVITPPPTV